MQTSTNPLMNGDPDFFFPVYRDARLAERLYGQIRSLYPQSRIVVVSDGRADQSFIQLRTWMRKEGMTFVETDERIKTAPYGGQWLHRLYYYALAGTTAKYLVRTEPDSILWRRINDFPDVPAAGTINARYNFLFLRGGAILFKRTTIEQMFVSDYFLDKLYCENPAYLYPRYSDDRFIRSSEERETDPIICSDLIQGHVMNRLSILPTKWAEAAICGTLDSPRIDYPEQYAFTHPHPLQTN